MKKLLFILCFAASIHTQAQVDTGSYCKQLLQDHYDAIEGRTYTTLKRAYNATYGKSTVRITALAAKDRGVMITFKSSNLVCIGEGDELSFLFEGEHRVQTVGDQDFNCSGEFQLYTNSGNFTPELLNYLTTYRLVAIRLYNKVSVHDAYVSKKDSDELKKAFLCLFNREY